ncbi:MAG: response regulator transcription factor [Chloroflexi bacterium]|nr:response regulator transcription factor [Chloroflexota bacterium]
MRVLVVDDHALVRRALASILRNVQDIEVVGEAEDGRQAIEAARQLDPDIVLMDVRMPNCNGIEATQRIKQEFPQIKVLALTISEEVNDLVQIITSGAEGYLLKSASPEDLIAGLRQVAEGTVALSPGMAAKVIREFAQRSESWSDCSQAALSPREVEVLQLVGNGDSNKEISARLSLSESTVRNHLHHVLEKLHLRNRMQAAIFATTYGLLSGPSQEKEKGPRKPERGRP